MLSVCIRLVCLCLHAYVLACICLRVFVCVCMYLSVWLCLYVSVRVCMYLPLSFCVCIYLYVSICVCLCLDVLCLFVSWMCLSVCTCPCQRVYLSVRPSAGGSVQSPWATKEQFIGFGWDRTKPTVSTYRRTCHILHVYHMVSLFIGQLADYMWPQVLVPLQTSTISSSSACVGR